MSLVNNASSNTDQADLAILALVETIRDQEEPSTASAVASLIGGAPVDDVWKRMRKLATIGLLSEYKASPIDAPRYQLTELGAEVMRRDMVGWSPSVREEARRTLELKMVRDGLLQLRIR